MGRQTTLYGYIEEPVYYPHGANEQAARRQNRGCRRTNAAALRRLPREDQWPYLYRGLFHVYGDEATVMGTYRGRIIHFGGSFKALEDDFLLWLDKFEALLGRLVWSQVRLHLVTEWMGRLDLEWEVPWAEQERTLYAPVPVPPTRWEFRGDLSFFQACYENAHRRPWLGRPIPPPPLAAESET
jgi:hypothetical protein